MLLQLLRDRGTAAIPGYQERPIRAIVLVDERGGYRGAFLDNADAENKRGRRLPAPQLKRTSASRPILFTDGADYLFGIPDAGKSATQAAARRDLHLSLAQRCATVTGNARAKAAAAFLTAVRNDEALATEIAGTLTQYPGDAYTLRIGDMLVIDEPEVQTFWAKELGLVADPGARADGMRTCGVCGAHARIPVTWPVSIKGIPGGQSAGTQLVSMNSDVYESFGQRRAAGASTCGPCGERIANAVNALLADKARHLVMGRTVYLSWHDGDGSFDLFDFLGSPHPEAVRDLLRSPLTAAVASLGAVDGRVHTIALSANAARAVVRSWIDSTVPEARRRLARYFEAQMVVRPWGEPAQPVSLRALAGATVRDFADLAPGTVDALLAGILGGRQLSPALIASVVRRVHVEDSPKVTHPQAALITWFLTQTQEEFAVPHHLDADLDNAAYHCGRALAEIDAIQRTALGKVNTSVVDRYFGAASSRPATVLGMLIRNAQDHLRKIRLTNSAAANAHEHRLTDVLGRLKPAGFPATLPLVEQTWFCLGFYHQRAAARAAVQERRAAAENGKVANEEAMA